MNCERCKGKIHSGKIEKIVKGNVTKCYCRHCFQAVLRDY
jgi:hypothetical protein